MKGRNIMLALAVGLTSVNAAWSENLFTIDFLPFAAATAGDFPGCRPLSNAALSDRCSLAKLELRLVYNLEADAVQYVNTSNGSPVCDLFFFRSIATNGTFTSRHRFGFLFQPGLGAPVGSAFLEEDREGERTQKIRGSLTLISPPPTNYFDTDEYAYGYGGDHSGLLVLGTNLTTTIGSSPGSMTFVAGTSPVLPESAASRSPGARPVDLSPIAYWLALTNAMASRAPNQISGVSSAAVSSVPASETVSYVATSPTGTNTISRVEGVTRIRTTSVTNYSIVPTNYPSTSYGAGSHPVIYFGAFEALRWEVPPKTR